MQECRKCYTNKSFDDFYKVKYGNGYNPVCKLCANNISRTWHKTKYKIRYVSTRKKIPEKSISEKRAKIAAYYREYFKNNPSKKIAKIFRQRLWRLTNGMGVKLNMVEIIGCDQDFLKLHLESQFLPGMNWDNHNKEGWHIDHKKPCSKFNLEDDEELKRCFHYTNLQPLWAIDNKKKSDKWVET